MFLCSFLLLVLYLASLEKIDRKTALCPLTKSLKLCYKELFIQRGSVESTWREFWNYVHVFSHLIFMSKILDSFLKATLKPLTV